MFVASATKFCTGLFGLERSQLPAGVPERFHIDLPAAENLPFLRQRIGRDPHTAQCLRELFQTHLLFGRISDKTTTSDIKTAAARSGNVQTLAAAMEAFVAGQSGQTKMKIT